MATATEFLSTYIEPLAADLTPQQAERILATKPPGELICRVEELAEKAAAGVLSERERSEYESYIDIDDVIGLLKAKARSVLARSQL